MKIVISGFYGLGNTGDEAILQSIISQLRSELQHPEITVLSLSPKKTAEDHHVNSIYRGWRHNNRGKIRALREADLLLSGGGGLLQDHYPTKFLFGPLPYYLLIVFLAKLCGTKVMFFSQGIGPIRSTWGKVLIRFFGNMADFITVRDSFSKDLLLKLKVTKPETVVTADIVFAFQPEEDDACINSLSIESKEKLVAVSVRPCPWLEDVSYHKKLANALDQLIEQEDITPIFVPMEGLHDIKESKLVVNLMQNKNRVKILGPNFTPAQYQRFFYHCEITIGMRLHFLIFSAIAGIPHIGLSYDDKVESLLKRTEMWNYSFQLSHFDENELVIQAREVLKNKELLNKMIMQNVAIMRKDALENIQLLKQHFV